MKSIKQSIHCDFCGSLAVSVARREDGKIAYCCEKCGEDIERLICEGSHRTFVTEYKIRIETPVWTSIGPIMIC